MFFADIAYVGSITNPVYIAYVGSITDPVYIA